MKNGYDMPSFDDNEILIARYLQNQMTPEEEEGFMRILETDGVLRGQYEDELLLQSLLGDDAETTNEQTEITFQPADEHIGMISEAMTTKSNLKILWRRYSAIAAIFIFCLVAAAIFFFKSRQKQDDKIPVVKTNQLIRDSVPTVPITVDPNATKKDSAALVVQPKGKLPAVHEKLPDLLRAFNKPYQKTGDDPQQASVAFAYYENKKFESLQHLTDAGVQVMGASIQDALARDYLHFYKGLAYLSQQQNDSAFIWFSRVMQSPDKTTALTNKVQWFSAIALLQANDTNAGEKKMKEIARSSSAYKKQAVLLLAKLHTQ